MSFWFGLLIALGAQWFAHLLRVRKDKRNAWDTTKARFKHIRFKGLVADDTTLKSLASQWTGFLDSLPDQRPLLSKEQYDGINCLADQQRTRCESPEAVRRYFEDECPFGPDDYYSDLWRHRQKHYLDEVFKSMELEKQLLAENPSIAQKLLKRYLSDNNW